MSSHIDSLPNELLAEIFISDKTDSNYRFEHNIRIPNEVVYSHVSRRWRDVATNHSTLWTTIYVIAHSSLLCLPHYLSRSRDCHLKVWIDHWGLDDGDAFDDGMNKITDIMNLLIPHIHRWSSLHVKGYFGQSAYMVLSHLEKLSAPVLRELVVKFDEAEEGSSFPLYILQGGAPLLTSIRLDMRCWPPMSALTTYTIYRLLHPALCMERIQVLASSHALRSLHLHGDVKYEEFLDSNPSRIRLDTLESLSLNMTFHLTSPLLLAISAPRLQTLGLEEVTADDLQMFFDSPRPSLVEFPALHTLSLDSVKLDKDSFNHLSRVFPSITHLKVSGADEIHIRRLAQLMGCQRPLYGTKARDMIDGARATLLSYGRNCIPSW